MRACSPSRPRNRRRARANTSRHANSSRPSWTAFGLGRTTPFAIPPAERADSLLAAHDRVVREHGSTLDPDQKAHLRTGFVHGWEIVPATARLCIMNLYLHGIAPDESPIRSGVDSLATDPGDRFSMVLTNPPFGKKSSVRIVNEEGELETESDTYERQDFWTATKNKATQLPPAREDAAQDARHLRHRGARQRPVRGRRGRDGAAEPAPSVPTCIPSSASPTGIFYAQGVKANVLFFDAKPRAREAVDRAAVGLRPLRDEQHYQAQDEAAARRADLDEFVDSYRPGERHRREADVEPGRRGRPLAGVRV